MTPEPTVTLLSNAVWLVITIVAVLTSQDWLLVSALLSFRLHKSMNKRSASAWLAGYITDGDFRRPLDAE